MKNLSYLVHFALVFSSCQIFSQTKLISYKSHSGDMKYFEKSIVENSFNTNYSNLGMAPQRYVTNSKLDSVIIIDDKKSVIITSNYCKIRGNSNPEKWKPGRDTVYNHPVFSQENVEAVKKELKRDYNFQNDLDSTVFLKYDKKTKEYKLITSKKVIKTAELKSFKSEEEIMYLLVLSIAVFVSVFIYRKNR
ncbi:hypothetical protein AB670_00834 [Chryseobacterium sp. MOF25P]|uniref:hypothetical protein n=1 Tax=unclassified Chryseobacterium TaxID=2593645 RepID=UPI0008054EE1|nr:MULTISPECIES: hypothetical protein [unclassified Chryseobacterium]OBW42750.1 hypothetical protein AB670_00834 [Chryseobacterium sp. MOF25P]OBW45553.1 hypothetical protein AB671_02326 [Chryseobacterium sp. BGARF1]